MTTGTPACLAQSEFGHVVEMCGVTYGHTEGKTCERRVTTLRGEKRQNECTKSYSYSTTDQIKTHGSDKVRAFYRLASGTN